jgi:hypothetical protein
MSVVVSIVNFIRSRGLTHRLFRTFLEEVSANYSDLLCHTEVRWLSSGRVLQRFVALRDEIVQLLENYPRKFPELHDDKWNNDLYFLCDITCHLNEINMQLQGKSKLIFEMITALQSFKMKLQFKSQLSRGETGHFPTCKKHIPLCKHAELGKRYLNDIELLIQEFEARLTFSKEEDTLLRLIEEPFSSDAEELPINLQMEVTELQSSSVYRNKHRKSSLSEFYSSLDVTKLKNLRDSALQVLSVFGSTYICEQTFSIMNMNKTNRELL